MGWEETTHGIMVAERRGSEEARLSCIDEAHGLGAWLRRRWGVVIGDQRCGMPWGREQREIWVAGMVQMRHEEMINGGEAWGLREGCCDWARYGGGDGDCRL
ncbi:hypothetical protein M0R45_007175 [Rubus argutus]|uniref:MHC class I antigen n=1 Tax=Rubus argutus TaxID=59490 RepID=A0AAW1YU61_RUBAR